LFFLFYGVAILHDNLTALQFKTVRLVLDSFSYIPDDKSVWLFQCFLVPKSVGNNPFGNFFLYHHFILIYQVSTLWTFCFKLILSSLRDCHVDVAEFTFDQSNCPLSSNSSHVVQYNELVEAQHSLQKILSVSLGSFPYLSWVNPIPPIFSMHEYADVPTLNVSQGKFCDSLDSSNSQSRLWL
jgi:hypothetical protein